MLTHNLKTFVQNTVLPSSILCRKLVKLNIVT